MSGYFIADLWASAHLDDHCLRWRAAQGTGTWPEQEMGSVAPEGLYTRSGVG